jgi:glycosyltransferase involved in cell wall biosynthesis
MKIAVIGVKAIPASQGGIERHAEELYTRLAARGHEVTVFCRSNATDDCSKYKGVRIKSLPSINTKHLDTITNVLLASILSVFSDYDIVHYHAIGPSLLSFIPRVRKRIAVCTTIHGLDWQRKKWGRPAAAMLKMGEKCASFFSHSIIAVSNDLTTYFNDKYPKCKVHYIPNGTNKPIPRIPGRALSSWGVEPRRYILYAGRLVPEKGCHHLLAAYKELKTDVRLVVAGAGSHSKDYVSSLHDMAQQDPRVVFTGFTSGLPLEELFSNALGFVLPSDLEGLPIALLEALGYGLPAVCSDIPPHLEVGRIGQTGQNGILFFKPGSADDLRRKLRELLTDSRNLRRQANHVRAILFEIYDWDVITEATEVVYSSIAKANKKARQIENKQQELPVVWPSLRHQENYECRDHRSR